jgi:predicted RNase H-like HicB family nuclease
MLTEYLQQALERAHYEIIQDSEPYYGEIPGLEGVWATGVTLEECRRNLASALEDWLFFSIAQGLPIPPVGTVSLRLPEKIAA